MRQGAEATKNKNGIKKEPVAHQVKALPKFNLFSAGLLMQHEERMIIPDTLKTKKMN